MKPGPTFSREEKLRARTLYLVKRWTPAEIAEKLAKEPRQISNLVNHMGWAKLRRIAEEKAAAASEEDAMTSAREFVESVAIRSEELTERGFDMVESAADSGDAKGFAMAASGTKTLVSLARQARGMDATTIAGGTVNMFFGAPVGAAGMKQAEKTEPEALEANGAESDLDFA